jgi:hypothetical protein
MSAKLTGMDKVLANINREVAKVEGRSVGGLLALGNVVLAGSNKRVPRELSNLHASGYVRKAQHNRHAVEVGYTAAYALPVHEAVGMKLRGKPRKSGIGVYWGPSGSAKFLEKSLRERKKDAASIVGRFVRESK